MRLVARIISEQVPLKTDVTTSSYEGFKFCMFFFVFQPSRLLSSCRGQISGKSFGYIFFLRSKNMTPLHPPILLPLTVEVVLALAFGFSQMSRYPLTSGPRLAWDLAIILAWGGRNVIFSKLHIQ